METSTLKQINEIVIKVLKKKDINLLETTLASDVEGWDSLNHTVIIAEIQKHFNIKFKLKEILKFDNIGDICNLVDNKINLT